MIMKVDYILGSLDLPMYGALRCVKEAYFYNKNKIDIKLIEYEKKGFKLPSKINYFYDIWFIKKNLRKLAIKHFTSQTTAYILNFIKPIKTIVTCYDLIPLYYINEEKNLLKKCMIKFWVNGLKKADRIIAISEFTKKEIIRMLDYPPEKIFIAYPGVDTSKYKVLKRNEKIAKKYQFDSDFFNIVYVGNEEPRMNIETIIRALAILKKQNKKIRLIKGGNPNSQGRREILIELIKKLGLEKDVIFTGYIDEKDMPQIYNLADLSIYPISYTGFGLPPLEAMACGCPVITSNKASLPEVVGDAAIICDPKNHNEMAEAILKIMSNNKLKKNLIKKGLKQAKKYTWRGYAQQTLDCYKSLEKE